MPILTKHSKKSSFIQTQRETEQLEGKFKLKVVPLEEMLKREIEPVEGKLKFKVIPSDDLLKNYVPRTNINRFEAAIVKESNFAVLKYISGHLDLRRIKKILLTASHSLYSKNVFNNVKAITEANNVRAIVDFKKVNYTRYVNKYFESINSLLPHTGIYIGCVESNRQRNKRLYHKKKKILAILFILTEFIFHRVLPKIKFFKGLYFGITRGKYRFLSTAETLGRLVSCGFDIIEYKKIRGITYFIVMKTREPEFDKNPSYGPLVKLNRIGKNGKIIKVFKFRTMHPYSEYIQDFVLRLNGYNSVGKPAGDFRLTAWGKIFRKYWLDEIPQLINVLKGEMKIMGVRPLSKVRFSEFPEDLQNERIREKPGCIPPYVALNMPSDKGNIEAERIYLKEKHKNPRITDIQYIFMGIANILGRKIHSS
ncbi:MAG: sugar transferase [Bacteroidota bacterium]|nr:sugar transferase [Bacteroidota bacterium]